MGWAQGAWADDAWYGTAWAPQEEPPITPPSAEEQPTGGWGFINLYERELRDQKRREQELERRRQELQQIADAVDQEIAALMLEGDERAERESYLASLSDLVAKHAQSEEAREYTERVKVAFERAIAKETRSALEALDREIQRAIEEEEFLLLATMMTIH